MAASSSSLASSLRRRPSLDFSLTGLVYSLMMIFMLLAALNTQANLLFGVFGLMVGILLVSWMLSRVVLQRLSVRRNLPKHAVAGDPMTVYYEIANAKRFWPSLSVSMLELDAGDDFLRPPQCYLLHAAARMTATVPVEMIPRRRGLHALDHYQMTTSFPFGFIKRAVIDRHKDVICVFPALAEVDRSVIALCRAADNTGDTSTTRAGGVDEFYGLREHRAGDNPRHIYWRRSARTGVLVSREMTRVTPPRLMILVDTYLAESSRPERGLVERAIAIAASLASAALEHELAVGLCAWSDEPITINPSRGKQQREEMLTLLARLPSNTTFDGTQLVGHFEWMIRGGTTVVIVTPHSIDLPLAAQSRGGVIMLSAEAEAAGNRFRFRPTVRFMERIPPEEKKRRKAEMSAT